MKNVVVICLDTVRKDTFDEYASHIQQLSEYAYEQCRAASSWSVPSHASLFTGRLPHQHGLTTNQRHFDALQRDETFLSSLDGYKTYGVSANAFAGPAFGFNRFFDEFSALSPRKRFPDGVDPLEYTSDDRSYARDGIAFLRAALMSESPFQSLGNGIVGAIKKAAPKFGVVDPFDGGATAVLKRAQSYMTQGTEPAFLFVNLMDAHLPLYRHKGLTGVEDVPASWTTLDWSTWELMGAESGHDSYWETRNSLYKSTIQYLDRLVASFIQRIQSEADRETVIIITADHGENLGTEASDFLVNHTSSLSEALLHVPLNIVTGGETKIKCPSNDYVSHLAMPDIVTGAANGQIEDVSSDRVVAEVAGRGPTPDPPSNDPVWDRALRCAYDSQAKTVWDSLGGCLTYQIDWDRPCWQRKGANDASPPSWVDNYFDVDIECISVEDGRNGQEIGAGTKQRLEELGYL